MALDHYVSSSLETVLFARIGRTHERDAKTAVFGMIFTVIIALEFERSLLVIAERDRGVVQVRTVILNALLAIVRKLMIIDMSVTNVQQFFALAAAVLALGGVYWPVRDQDGHEDV
jgi:uncharacterized membrane protein (DUF373 family)